MNKVIASRQDKADALRAGVRDINARIAKINKSGNPDQEELADLKRQKVALQETIARQYAASEVVGDQYTVLA